MGFIDKLIEMFKIRKISARSQARDGTIRRIIHWVCRNEGKFIADQIIHFKSTYLQSIIAPKIKK